MVLSDTYLVFVLAIFHATALSFSLEEKVHTSFRINKNHPRFLQDSLFPNCNVQRLDYIGDGQCDRISNYNTAACGWDGGDCCAETCVGDCPSARMQCRDPQVILANSNCSSSTINLATIGDGVCDNNGLQNTYECLWDGGDCCEASCQPGLVDTCNTTTFYCKDPQYKTSPSPTTSKPQPTSSKPQPSPIVLSTSKPTVPPKASSKPTVTPVQTAKPTNFPTPLPTTAKPTTPNPVIITSQPTKNSTPLPTPTTTTQPSPACTQKIPTTTELKPFYLFLSLPPNSDPQDIDLRELNSITNAYLNQYFRNATSLSTDGTVFKDVILSTDNDRTTNEQNGLILRPAYIGEAYFTIESFCNESNATLPYSQQLLLTNLTESAFQGNDSTKEYNNALHSSTDAIISQMNLKAFSYENKTYEQITNNATNNNNNSNSNNSTTTAESSKLNTTQIVLISVFGFVLLILLAGLGYFIYQKRRSNRASQPSAEVKDEEDVATHDSSPMRSKTYLDNNTVSSKGSDNAIQQDDSIEVFPVKKRRVSLLPFRKSSSTPENKSLNQETPLPAPSCDSQDTTDLLYSYSVDHSTNITLSKPGPSTSSPVTTTSDRENNVSTSEESVHSMSTCTADVMELAATIQYLDEKVTKLEQLDVVGTAGLVESKVTSTSGREIQASSSFESRGCASAVTNPFTMKGRQVILPNKSYDSQASNLSSKFSVVDMKTAKDAFRGTKRTVAITSPASAAVHSIDGYRAPIETNVLRTISSDASESTGNDTPLGPPQIHRAMGDNSALEFGASFDDTQDHDSYGVPCEFNSTHSCVTIKMANSYDRIDVVSTNLDADSKGIPKNVNIVFDKILSDSPPPVDRRRFSNPIFQAMRFSNKAATTKSKIPPPPPPIPLPPPMDLADVKPINQIISNQNEQEVFRVMERNGSFEVDDAVTNPTETSATHLKGTQVVSPSECRNHPMSKMFAPPNKRRIQSERPKPTSQLGGAPVDPYRRLGRRVSTVREEEHEEDSSTDEKKLNERSRDIMFSLSDDASDPFNEIEDGDLPVSEQSSFHGVMGFLISY